MFIGAPFFVCQSDSIAASFVGCVSARISALMCPWTSSKRAKTRAKTAATRNDLRKKACSEPRSRCHAETPRTKNPASTNAPLTVCRNSSSANFWLITAKKSSSSIRPLRRTKPTGWCMKALATRIQKAEMFEATATSQIVVRWSFGESRFQPKNQTAMKVDSRKKASVASTASSEPKMSPTYLE